MVASNDSDFIVAGRGADMNTHGELNTQGEWRGNAPQAASSEGPDSIARPALEKEADINAKGSGDGSGSALHAASHHGHYAIAWFFLEKGANVDAEGDCYRNALQPAVTKVRSAVASEWSMWTQDMYSRWHRQQITISSSCC